MKSGSAAVDFTNQELYLIGKKQKMIIWLVLLWIVCIIYRPLMIIPSFIAIFKVYELARALKYKHPGLLTFGMFVPFVGLICLARLMQDSTHALRSKGIKVGVMGANKNQLRNLYKNPSGNP